MRELLFPRLQITAIPARLSPLYHTTGQNSALANCIVLKDSFQQGIFPKILLKRHSENYFYRDAKINYI